MLVLQEHLSSLPPLSESKRDWVKQVKKISMLHPKSLEALYQLAGASTGTILEIGPYIGGSTIALAQGLKDHPLAGERRRVITVEGGGAYPAHPQLPSKDILADLETNLEQAGVRELVDVVVGWTFDYFVIRRIQKLLDSEPVGLMVVDSNGLIRPDFLHWGPYCNAPCYLVIDDYFENGDLNIKSPSIQSIMSPLIQEGQLEEMAILPWGTWFGKIVKPIRLPRTMTPAGPGTWQLHPPFTPMGRTGWISSLDLDEMPDLIERLNGPSPKALTMYEDGRPLGPPHSPLDKIKEGGRGTFHQWGGRHSTLLMFTTTDNSDPNRNGRTYTTKAGD